MSDWICNYFRDNTDSIQQAIKKGYIDLTDIWLVKVGETTEKTASAEYVDHGVELDDDQGVGYVLLLIGEVTMQRSDLWTRCLLK